MVVEHFQTFIMQEQPHVLRYVAIVVGIAVAAGIAVYFFMRKRKQPVAKK